MEAYDEKPHSDGSAFQFVFSMTHKIEFGTAVYVSGSTFDLGQWDVKKAIRLQCHKDNMWIIRKYLPVNLRIEYKFFIGKYQKIDPQHIHWIGNHNKFIQFRDGKPIENQNLTLMSFNLRYQNKRDTGELHWNNRRENCLQVIQNCLPCCVGVQQAILSQRQYLQKKLENTYEYIGASRDNNKGQECGIFIRKDRFLLLEHRFVWFSESKKPFSLGYDAKLPRYCTCLILIDLKSQNYNAKLMVVNLHLDHEGKQARKYSMLIVLQLFEQMKKKYEDLNDFFVMGDFNTSENDKIFQPLAKNKSFKFNSLRAISPKTNKSLTFNGFKPQIIEKICQIIIHDRLTIDHIFASLDFYNPIEFQVVIISGKIVSDHYPILAQLKPKRVREKVK